MIHGKQVWKSLMMLENPFNEADDISSNTILQLLTMDFCWRFSEISFKRQNLCNLQTLAPNNIFERTRPFKFIRTNYVISRRGKEQNGAKFTIRDHFYSLTGSIKNIWEFWPLRAIFGPFLVENGLFWVFIQ